MTCFRGKNMSFPIVICFVMADIILIFNEKDLVDLKLIESISINHCSNYKLENHTFAERLRDDNNI